MFEFHIHIPNPAVAILRLSCRARLVLRLSHLIEVTVPQSVRRSESVLAKSCNTGFPGGIILVFVGVFEKRVLTVDFNSLL